MSDAKIAVEVLDGNISEEQHQVLHERFGEVLAEVLSAPVVDVRVAFKIGDVVSLNSGGTAMTVSEVKTDYVCTQWFTDTAEPKVMQRVFIADTLRKVKE